jgi:alkanesulfonate monooxygenase SsuD/methylene tetrahydromethanopterin reductase-like flavin-dependent oxidoreductase (luciferase family)
VTEAGTGSATHVMQQLWDESDAPYVGEHYRLERTLNSPQPLRRPPILIGGGGERKTLRLVAQYARVPHTSTASPQTDTASPR